jgi:hypothetical protein
MIPDLLLPACCMPPPLHPGLIHSVPEPGAALLLAAAVLLLILLRRAA